MKKRLALVTGATGTIGPTLVSHLINQGYKVRTYNLDIPVPGLFPAEIQHIQGDVTNAEAVASVMADVDVVFHLAALLHIENPSPEMEGKYHKINVGGSQIVATEAVKAGVRRLVYFSTVKVYGIHQYPPVTEQQPCAPRTMYARTKFEGEQAVHATSDLETVVLRLSAVYGPQLRGAWRRLVEAIRRGWFIPVGNLANRRSLVYIEDVAQAAMLAAQHPRAPSNIYNVVGHEVPTFRQIMESIYTSAGRNMPRIHIPARVAIFVAVLLTVVMRILGGRSPITPDSVRQLTDDETYDGTALADLGYQPSVTLDVGWKLTLDAIACNETE
jgi:UDP-glucose 4-epimerase